MSILDRTRAAAQYDHAYKLGRINYSTCIARGIDPAVPALDDLLGSKHNQNRLPIGLVDIPIELIAGTATSGRSTAFARNFMPILPSGTEFASKWISLCAAHLDPDGPGIVDPIICTEYMGRFYVIEGNKRVSVLKSFDALTIPGIVTRIIPPAGEDTETQVYYEFMEFYKLSRTYEIHFHRPGGFSRLPAALGFAPGYKWTEDDRREIIHAYRKLRDVFEKLNEDEHLPLEAGDVLLVWLKLYSIQDLNVGFENEISKQVKAIWPDIRLIALGTPVAVNTEPEDMEKGGLLRALGIGRPGHLSIAFIHSFDPQKSAWTAAHELGRKQLEEAMGDKITVTTQICTADTADECIEQAIDQGAQVIFTTTPPLIDACRKAAAKHPQVRLFNCSLSMPYTGVRSYYSRMYEAKFITGAIAGAMATEDRIGYIANYPIAGTPAAINAFAIGARLTNPRARISLKWSCLPGNPASDLLEEGVTIVSNRENAAGENHHAWDWGTYQVEKNGPMVPLASPCWDWGNYYVKVIQSMFAGTWEHGNAKGEAVNDWWGLSTGVVDVMLSDKLPEGVRQLAEILKNGIISGIVDPFHAIIHDQAGAVRNDGTAWLSPQEIIDMDWLCDTVEGSIPTFDELIPASRGLVRLLGLERDRLLPEVEDGP